MKKFVVFFVVIVLTVSVLFSLNEKVKTEHNKQVMPLLKVQENPNPPTSPLSRAYATVGAGGSTLTATGDTPYGTYYEDGQNQFLFTAAELTTAGLPAGDITGIGWNVASASGDVCNGFEIGLKHTTATSPLTGFETGFTSCYTGAPTPVANWNYYNFSTDFTWDGTSNVLVMVCFDNTSWGSNSSVYGDAETGMNAWAYNDGTAGCTDPYEGTSDNRPQTRFQYTSGDPPACTTETDPLDGDVCVPTSGNLTWAVQGDATGYYIYFGTDGGGVSDPTNIENGTDLGNVTTYAYAGLANATIHYWKIVPYNTYGSATGCPIWDFTTGDQYLQWTETFNTGVEHPPGWTETTNSAIGWFVTLDGSSSYFTIPAGPDSYYECSNDDAANDDGSVDYLITPSQDFSGYNCARLDFDSFYTGAYGQIATIEVRVSGGGWTILGYAPTNVAWISLSADLSAYCGPGFTDVEIAFHSDDAATWASGWAIDNVELWGDPEPPLPVTLTNFTAEYTAEGLTLFWTTQSEIDNMGWNIYRGEDKNAFLNDETITVNPALIEGQGTTTEPTEYSFEDENEVEENQTYWYWIESVDFSGTTDLHDPISLTIPESGEDPVNPYEGRYGLFQNVPNPLNNTTKIGFSLKEVANCELTIYNTKGQVVKRFVKNNTEFGDFIWNGKDETGRNVKTGIYFYKLNAGDESFIKKMILAR